MVVLNSVIMKTSKQPVFNCLAVGGHLVLCLEAAYFLFYKLCLFFLHSCIIYSVTGHPNMFQLCCFHVLWCKSAYSICNLQKLYLFCKHSVLRLQFWKMLPVWTEHTVQFGIIIIIIIIIYYAFIKSVQGSSPSGYRTCQLVIHKYSG
jgi:hypothetical protein